jgi:hypothetical protein
MGSRMGRRKGRRMGRRRGRKGRRMGSRMGRRKGRRKGRRIPQIYPNGRQCSLLYIGVQMKTGRPRKSTKLTIDLGPYFAGLAQLAQSKQITPSRLAVMTIVNRIEKEGKV